MEGPRAAKPLVWCVDLSVGFSLQHGPVIAVADKVLPHRLPAAALILVNATIAAFVSFRLFERPVGIAIQRRCGGGRRALPRRLTRSVGATF
ncbi:hypothetical protein BJF92_21150 [Rhizobium rhizosphaerae]|uniref:Uncharacterized protein n=1 Tax=Xaviernesmea rhizosphaerae TaxID=1672749 RepID=A0A1Q9ANZ1_9HYPH|nr:hypothetical protein [Xaviernesmea rhizosphaerae]OLP57017.1 hypothetical protein BJF92_21150 [Xaviernesmea rhizosphaerae]